MPILSQTEYSILVKEAERASISPKIIDASKSYLANIMKIRQATRAKVGMPAVIPTTPVPVKVHSSSGGLTPEEEKAVREGIEWGVGEHKRWKHIDDMIIETIQTAAIFHGGGSYGVDFERLVPWLNKHRQEFVKGVKEVKKEVGALPAYELGKIIKDLEEKGTPWRIDRTLDKVFLVYSE